RRRHTSFSRDWSSDVCSSDLDVTDADPPVAVGDRVAFRMSYGAMLSAMTSEYVEKVPIHDVDVAPRRRMVQVVADSQAAGVLARAAERRAGQEGSRGGSALCC